MLVHLNMNPLEVCRSNHKQKSRRFGVVMDGAYKDEMYRGFNNVRPLICIRWFASGGEEEEMIHVYCIRQAMILDPSADLFKLAVLDLDLFSRVKESCLISAREDLITCLRKSVEALNK
ncbi:unnamed protein product [marine sediment metagenome]|uniref:Uncharacterized protein n=1 Tax=marine sediment metagenome TaxID=412755 RepID=X0S6M3_9ZZZZ